MKKATIILTIISILISGVTFYVIQITDKKDFQIGEVTEIRNEINALNTNTENSIEASDDDFQYYYNDLNLNENQYILVNECMQWYLKDGSFKNANNCEETVINLILNQRGEIGFLKSIMGDMLSYTKNDVYIKTNYINQLIASNHSESNLKDNLILSFLNRYRDPIKLQELYSNNKGTLFNYMPKSIYNKVYKNYINTLINSYNEIHNKADKELFYKEIYFKAEKQNRQSDYWNITFWKRRELEKNDHLIYTILNEINAYYNN
jgi:hypothetical protein